MDAEISDLLRIISEEIKIYRNLIVHAQRKTALLIQGRVDAILESDKLEEAFNVKLRGLENEMAGLCRYLSRIFRIPDEQFTLLRLADNLEQPLAQQIRSQTALFGNMVKQLKSVSRRNMRLIEKSIQYSKGLLDFVSVATGSYKQTGLFKPPFMHPTFSQRA
jgi:hypothetical protein